MKLLKLHSSLLILFCTTQIFSQQWVQTSGPEGGNVHAVVLSGAYLFAGLSPGGVYRSSDMGGNWIHSSTGFVAGDDNVQALYSYNNNVYAGTKSWLYSSTDNGNNWSRIPGFMGSEVTDIKSSGIYLYAATYGGVSVSSDNGITWSLNNNGLTNLYSKALVLKDNKLILATEGGVFISSDNGVNWINVSSGLTQIHINDMTRKGNDIYAATAGGGVFKSTNNGSNWFYSGSGILYPNVLSIEVHDSVLYAADFSSGIYSSTNNGLFWEEASFNKGIPNNPTTWCLRSTGSMLFAGFLGDGIYGTTNSGLSWSNLNSGIIATTVGSFTSANGLIFAAAQKRIFSSSDNGNTWLHSSNGLNCIYFTCLNQNGNDLYAGSGCGVYLSSNSGLYWQSVNSGLGNLSINDIASNTGNVFVSTQDGVFHTTNRGSSWLPVNNGLTSIYYDMLKYYNGTLFVYTYDGLFRSTNNGQLWIPSGSGFPQFTSIEDIALHNGILFAAASNGIYSSSNNGASWILRATGGTSSIVSTGNTLVASSFSQFRYSSNNGSSWLPLNSGFNSICNSLFASDSSIFAGTSGDGVYKFDKSVIGINNQNENIATDFELYNNFPNPFNPITTLRFSVPRKSYISLTIYDIKGSLAAELYTGNIVPGFHEFKWNAESFASGIYFYTLETNNFKVTKKNGFDKVIHLL